MNGRRLTKFAGPGVSFESVGAKAAEVLDSKDLSAEQKGIASTIAAEKARQAAINAAIAKQAPLSNAELAQLQSDAVSATVASLS